MKIPRSDDVVVAASESLRLIKRTDGESFKYVIVSRNTDGFWVYTKTIEWPKHPWLLRLLLGSYVCKNDYEEHAINVYHSWVKDMYIS